MLKYKVYTAFILTVFLLSAQTGCQNASLSDNTTTDIHVETIESSPLVLPLIPSTIDPEEISASIHKTSEEPPAPGEPPSITILMAGDILLHTPFKEAALQDDGTYNYTAIFSHTKNTIEAADLALVNQEVIIGGSELGISGYPAFNAPYEVSDALVDTGFDVICHATNHALDKGKTGLLNCISHWQESYPDIEILGIHDAPDTNIYIYEQNDIKVAVLNYTYGTNGIALPADMPYAVDLLDKEKVVSDIKTAEELADFTIVCPHWGTEYRLTPDSSQNKWTKIFLENGVDLVLGTHPHVIEPIEYIEDETTHHRMLVYYSLGNFVNWTSGQGDGVANRMVGGLAQVTLSQADDDTITISEYGVTPVICHVTPGTNGITVFPIDQYSQEKSLENHIRKQDPSFDYNYCVKLCDQVWGELWQIPATP